MDVKQTVLDIKTMMGYPTVRLELSDTQIENLVQRAYKKIKPYITDRKLITFQPAPCVDLSDEGVVDVVRIYPTQEMTYVGGPERELLFDFQTYQTIGNPSMKKVSDIAVAATEDYDIPFRFANGKLYISRTALVGSLTAECLVDIKLEDLRDERASMWIQSYAEALVKEVLGRIRGKFKSSNLPVEIDSDQLLNEAQSEKERLESELYEQDFGNFFILR